MQLHEIIKTIDNGQARDLPPFDKYMFDIFCHKLEKLVPDTDVVVEILELIMKSYCEHCANKSSTTKISTRCRTGFRKKSGSR